MHFSKYSLFLLILLISDLSIAQQSKAAIQGIVIEQSTMEPMEFVTVVLFQTKDSLMISATVTDKKGNYLIKNIPVGNYYIQISFIGFETSLIPNISIVDQTTISLAKTEIKISPHVLNDVIVTAEKSLLETTIDKRVYNVGKDIMSSSGSASEILENIPSLTVSIDGAVSLRGSSNVTILINGKPSAMMRLNSATALQQIPASTLERVEIITNPSVKYKPDGTAGIINLVLKKEKRAGWNGNIIANLGNDDRYNATISLNYKPSAVNFFGSYGYRHDNRNRSANYNRLTRDNAGVEISFTDFQSFSDFKPKSHMANAGLDYTPNEKNSLSVSGNYFLMNVYKDEVSRTMVRDPQNKLTNDFNRDESDHQYERETEFSANYEHKFDKEDHVIKLDLNLSDFYEKEDNDFTEIYRLPLAANAYDRIILQEWEKAGEASIEYTNTWGEDIEWESGYVAEWGLEDYDFYSEYFNESNASWIKNISKSNRFNFKQMVHAAYLIYNQSFDKFGFQLGLRAEDAIINTYLVEQDSSVDQRYFKWYPGVHLSYELNNNAKIQLSYSKRINRPDGGDLNPFPEYEDPRNLRAGNPLLKPEQTHSLELAYHYRNDVFSFLPSLYYRYAFDDFSRVTSLINDSTYLTTQVNLSNNQSGGLELIFSWPYKKLLTLNVNGNIFYNQIDASNLGYTDKKSNISANFGLNANFNITNTSILQLNSYYRSAGLTPQGRYLPRYSVNAGFKQDVLGNKASILVTFSDIFNTMRWRSEINSTELIEESTRKRASQSIYIGFSYRFGNSTKKTDSELKYEDN